MGVLGSGFGAGKKVVQRATIRAYSGSISLRFRVEECLSLCVVAGPGRCPEVLNHYRGLNN